MNLAVLSGLECAHSKLHRRDSVKGESRLRFEPFYLITSTSSIMVRRSWISRRIDDIIIEIVLKHSLKRLTVGIDASSK